MSVTTACHNGRPRKQLSDQLDRLDGIIDVLADALPEAVRDAVRDGMADALRRLVADALADPATLAALRQAVAPPVPTVTPATPGSSRRAAFLARCRTASATVRAGVVDLVGTAIAAVRVRTERVKAWAAATAAKARSVRQVCHVAWHLKRAAGVAVGVGVAVAAVSLASHPVATALSGVGAGLATFAVQAGLWCRTVARPWRA
ncbi:hypothetical protein [Limnoglobus roseus]|uniref:Uncharacterized protein n=1 Tax=Limnoglobus roseus TaxID=2598579 RepID=A0A5C1AE52_9BACT|nr:hypothetical protein [Limnoglobus roseus]QEL16855.1 hypothetical protein PX52LOC_03829 [Limnoglobus roseus]